MNDLTADELDQALAAHQEVCRSYPRGGAGEDMFTTPADAPRSDALEPRR
jgi:hypothetical protein